MKTKRLSRRSRAFYTLLMSAAPMARKSRRAEFDAGVRAAYRGFSSVAESEKKRPLREAPYRLGFILIDFEQGVDLGDLQHLSYLFCQAQQLQGTAAVQQRRVAGNQLAEAGAVDVSY